MSHFPVLVSVDDSKTLEEVMMPYHEFECTGIDQYIQDIDITDEVRKEGLDYYGLEDRVVSDESQIDLKDAHKYGYAIMQNGELVKAIDRTNPNKRWDWYVAGGRWSGYFGRDEGTKAEFEFDQLRAKELDRGLEHHRRFNQARREAKITLSDIERAKKLLADHWKNNEDAHQLYADPVDLAFDDKAFDAIDQWSWTAKDAAEMRLSEQDYANKHQYDAPLHAFIDLQGRWNEIGEMGWWGMCDDENDSLFNGEHGAFWTFINSLPDDTHLYIVDCHI